MRVPETCNTLGIELARGLSFCPIGWLLGIAPVIGSVSGVYP